MKHWTERLPSLSHLDEVKEKRDLQKRLDEDILHLTAELKTLERKLRRYHVEINHCKSDRAQIELELLDAAKTHCTNVEIAQAHIDARTA